MSERGQQWDRFSALVRFHIDNYTVRQYGDMPEDFASDLSMTDMMKQISKYCTRAGSSTRGVDEQKRDFLKIAHYACMGYYKFLEEQEERVECP